MYNKGIRLIKIRGVTPLTGHELPNKIPLIKEYPRSLLTFKSLKGFTI